MKDSPFKVYLGKTKDEHPERVYLEGFSWNCSWYWGGGIIETYREHEREVATITHFDGCFLNVVDVRGHSLGDFVSPWDVESKTKKVISNGASVWESLDFFLDDAQFTQDEWWRIKDLYKQFYKLREAAEVFQHGGHCTDEGRNKAELNKSMAKKINAHIEAVIIPEVLKALKVKQA